MCAAACTFAPLFPLSCSTWHCFSPGCCNRRPPLRPAPHMATHQSVVVCLLSHAVLCESSQALHVCCVAPVSMVCVHVFLSRLYVSCCESSSRHSLVVRRRRPSLASKQSHLSCRPRCRWFGCKNEMCVLIGSLSRELLVCGSGRGEQWVVGGLVAAYGRSWCCTTVNASGLRCQRGYAMGAGRIQYLPNTIDSVCTHIMVVSVVGICRTEHGVECGFYLWLVPSNFSTRLLLSAPVLSVSLYLSKAHSARFVCIKLPEARNESLTTIGQPSYAWS